MALSTGKFLEKLAKKTGLDINTEVFKPLLEFKDEIPDEVVAALDNKLLTVEAAKSNSEVNKVLRQQILGAADVKMDDIIKEMKLQPGEDFVAEKNSYEKLNMLSKLIYDAGQKKAAADNNAGVHETLKKEKEAFAAKETEYQKQFKEFQAQLAKANEEREKVEKNYNSTLENDRIQYDIYKKLLGKNYDLPAKMDDELKVQTAFVVVNNELNKRGFSIKRDENKKLGIFDKDGNPGYSENHNLLEFDSFLDAALAENKLLKINDSGQQQQSSQNQNGAQYIQNNQANNNGNAAIMSEIQAQISEFSKQ